MSQSSSSEPLYAPFFGFAGVASAIVFSAIGSAYGTAKAGQGVAAAGVMHPEGIIKSIIPIIMAGMLAIYGFIIAITINLGIKPIGGDNGYTLFKGFAHLASGICVGLSGLAAGVAIGIVGDVGVRGAATQPRLFFTTVLMLIFAEVLALYGTTVAILITLTKAT